MTRRGGNHWALRKGHLLGQNICVGLVLYAFDGVLQGCSRLADSADGRAPWDRADGCA
jgi:hypothetical protein